MIETADPDVVALDENNNVFFTWQDCPDVEKLSDLASNRVAEIAIRQASLIRRRDGFILKSRDGALGWPENHPLHDHPTSDHNEPTRLERVDLIPPSDELDAVPDHEGLPLDKVLRVALFKALMVSDDEHVVVEDKDIVKALGNGWFSVEHREKDGVMIIAAHLGPVTAHRVDGEGDDDD